MAAEAPGAKMVSIRECVRLLGPLVAAAVVGGCAGITAPQYGVHEGRLAPCSGQRGCVSSQAKDAAHLIAPLTYRGSRHEARADLLIVIKSWPDAKLVSNHRTYLRVEFPSAESAAAAGPAVMSGSANIDETEFYLPTDARVIHIRSAPSRNFPDSGMNRARVEAIRAKFESLQE